MDGLYNSGGVVNKSELWNKYGYLVRHEALKMQVRLPATVELDDLIQAGVVGLLSAVDDFDPKKGVDLGAYIVKRIRWALGDELRERDWVPRRIRTSAREMTRVIQRLEQEKGGAVSEAEVAAGMGIPLQDYQQLLAETNISQLYSLDEIQEEYADSFERVESEHQKLDPLNKFMISSLTNKISQEIRQLPKREQMLLNLYYQQNLNMKEIGLLLDVTETRVSQLHSQAIKYLRSRLDINDNHS
ncbi:flagellar biosynthesis sigma factor [Leclercia adecarboxylata]|nr:flagellar biosynthesis sigma factor [Leclercia adecarboxylata]KMN61739.1 flagellar biosynthesis sigma factor [Leclercia sp. LK8]